MTEAARKIWRETFAVQLPLAGLISLKTALDKDDPRLLQAQTISPPPLQCVEDWPVEGACAIAWAAAGGAPDQLPSRRFGDVVRRGDFRGLGNGRGAGSRPLLPQLV